MINEVRDTTIYIIKDFTCPVCGDEVTCMMPITGRGWECEECGYYDPYYKWIPYELNYDTVVTDMEERHLIARAIVCKKSVNE